MPDVIDADRSRDPDAARWLAFWMSEISEERWCAQWLVGLEYLLWSTLLGSESIALTEAEIGLLQDLSEKCGGWIYWHDASAGADPHDVTICGCRFVQTDEWGRMLDAYLAQKDQQAGDSDV